MKSRLEYLSLIVTILLFSNFNMAFSPVRQTPPLRASLTQVTSHFPDGITFVIEVESDFEITHVDFIRHLQGNDLRHHTPIEIEPSTDLEITFHWDTLKFTVAPSSKIVFQWELEDSQGNKLITPEEEFYYDDIRFEWNEVSDNELTVRWYEGGQSFGNLIFQVARGSLNKMKKQTDHELEFQVLVLLYANDEDYKSWHFYVEDWVGGGAYPSKGITVQVLPPHTSPEWILSVIPHEIAHLFFYQIVDSVWANWPPWISEGFAQYYELVSQDDYLELAAQAAEDGDLIPLMDLDVDIGFGRSLEEVHLAYAESISAITYIIETYGEESIERLVDAFREGIKTRDAIHQALGVTWEEFEAGWITWMGVPVTPMPSPIPTQILRPPTYPPPTDFASTALPPTNEQAVSLDPTPTRLAQTEVGEEGDSNADESSPICGSIISIFIIPLFVFMHERRQIL